MSEAEQAILRAIRAVDASLSVLVVAREALVEAHGRATTPQPLQEPDSGVAPAGPCINGQQHPTDQLIDVGVGTGAMVCQACGEQA